MTNEDRFERALLGRRTRRRWRSFSAWWRRVTTPHLPVDRNAPCIYYTAASGDAVEAWLGDQFLARNFGGSITFTGCGDKVLIVWPETALVRCVRGVHVLG